MIRLIIRTGSVRKECIDHKQVRNVSDQNRQALTTLLRCTSNDSLIRFSPSSMHRKVIILARAGQSARDLASTGKVS
jgi:hypothetical protein